MDFPSIYMYSSNRIVWSFFCSSHTYIVTFGEGAEIEHKITRHINMYHPELYLYDLEVCGVTSLVGMKDTIAIGWLTEDQRSSFASLQRPW